MSTVTALPARSSAQAVPERWSRFEVAAQVIVGGPQEQKVQALQPLSGTETGQIAVRVGRLLIYVTDREALHAFSEAWREAEALADQAFGSVLPPPTYRPRSSGRRSSR